MAFENTDFEAEGTTTGAAASWTVSSLASVFETAAFDGEFGYEDYESGWAFSGSLNLLDSELVEADWGGVNAESFDRSWGPMEGDIARLFSSNAGPFSIFNLATLLLEVDGAAAQTITFVTADFVDILAATPAEIATRILTDTTDVDAGPTADARVLLESQLIEVLGGSPSTLRILPTSTADQIRAVIPGSGLAIADLTDLTLFLAFDGGPAQTITFLGSEASDANVASTINNQVEGGSALTNAGQVDLYSSETSPDSHVEIFGGTALAEIGHVIGKTNRPLGFRTETQTPGLPPRVAVGSGHSGNSQYDENLGLLTESLFASGVDSFNPIDGDLFAVVNTAVTAAGTEAFELWNDGQTNDGLEISTFNVLDDEYESFNEEWSGNEDFIDPTLDIFPNPGSQLDAADFNTNGLFNEYESYELIRDAQTVARILIAIDGGDYTLSVNNFTARYQAQVGDSTATIADELATRVTNPGFRILGTHIGSGRITLLVDGEAAPNIMIVTGPTSASVENETLARKVTEWLSPLFGA